jgi:hypothetical protein
MENSPEPEQVLQYRGYTFLGIRIWTEKSKRGNILIFREGSQLTPFGELIKYRVDSDFNVLSKYAPIELATCFVKNETILNKKSKAVFKKSVDFRYEIAKEEWLESERKLLKADFSNCKPIEIICDREKVTKKREDYHLIIDGNHYFGYDYGEEDEFNNKYIVFPNIEKLNQYELLRKQSIQKLIEFENEYAMTGKCYITNPEISKYNVPDAALLKYLK